MFVPDHVLYAARSCTVQCSIMLCTLLDRAQIFFSGALSKIWVQEREKCLSRMVKKELLHSVKQWERVRAGVTIKMYTFVEQNNE